ncbi:hypothetical protein [Anoxybacillus sp. B7M1]|uniref:hypothetical protein n=1 Tax=Anoxybacillus sp. B7M1 TaxID=1490057 RepID=UPI001E5F300A|nr:MULTISPECIES: hypothetical protein [unclassified Anoxybacillus]
MCDLCRHHPVALLPNRLPQTLTEWLKIDSHVQGMSRDGLTGFRQGMSNPSILPVYDRWHLICSAFAQRLAGRKTRFSSPIQPWCAGRANQPVEND